MTEKRFKEENEQLKKEKEHIENSFKIADLAYQYRDLQKIHHNTDIALEKCKAENEQLKKEKENLKKELWESEKAYIEETNHSAIDIERDIAWLKEEFEREYWND